MRPVIFDFNGTLYNDTGFHTAAWKDFFEHEFGIHMTAQQVHDRCIGPSNREILGGVLTDPSPEDIVKYSLLKEEYYRRVCRSKPENLRLIEGAPAALDSLKRLGIPFALATSSEMDNVEFYMNDLGLKRWFTMDNIVYIDGTIPNKPDPAFYREAARRLNVDPAECVIVEDSPTGIEGALNAGVHDLIIMDRTMTPQQWARFPQLTVRIHDYNNFIEVLDSFK